MTRVSDALLPCPFCGRPVAAQKYRPRRAMHSAPEGLVTAEAIGRIAVVARWLELNRPDDEQLALLAVDLREQVAALASLPSGKE